MLALHLDESRLLLGLACFCVCGENASQPSTLSLTLCYGAGTFFLSELSKLNSLYLGLSHLLPLRILSLLFLSSSLEKLSLYS